jgi:hypothetical protein
MNLDADTASTIIVLAILLGGALAAIVAGLRRPAANPAETFTDPHRWN